MFQFRASVAYSCPELNQYCVFAMDSSKLLNAINKITVSIQTQNGESMLF